MVDPVTYISGVLLVIHFVECTVVFGIEWKYWFSSTPCTWHTLELDLKDTKIMKKK